MFSKELNKLQKKKIIIFYLLACLVSWPFFAIRDIFNDSWIYNSIPSKLLTFGYMSGPAIAAIACFIYFKGKHKRTITFKGTSLSKGLIFYFVPFVLFWLVTTLNPGFGDLPPNYFLISIPFGFILILGEELGWRGFLQDVLRGMSEWKKWLLLGFLWETWHFTRGITHGTFVAIVLKKIIMYASVILLTIIIGKLTEKTKSLFVAITFHTWLNMMFEFNSINAYITFGLNIILWTFLTLNWNKNNEV